MTFEADLTAVIEAAGCERVSPDVAPVGTARPYVTYQQVGGDVLNPVANVPPGRRHGEMQIKVWADTRAEAVALMRAIEDAMRAATAFQAKPIAGFVAEHDADIPVYGCRQDFSCWHYT